MPYKDREKRNECKRRWAKNNPKQVKINSWKQRHGDLKLSKEEWSELYDKWLITTNCECCGKIFDKSEYKNGYEDKQLDHCHKTLKFRNFLCGKCNKIRAYIDNDYQTIMKLMTM
jgi:hypothetical protein